jgi:protein gp37
LDRRRPINLYRIDWVIAGGESGPNARAMLPSWARKLRDQCLQGGVRFHFKQWGHWAPIAPPRMEKPPVRKFWDEFTGTEIFMEPKGKKIAGRQLDGTTWDELPVAS